MKKNILTKIGTIALLSLLVLSSCGSRRSTVRPATGGVPAGGDNSIQSFEMSNLDFYTLSGRAKTKVVLGTKSHDVTTNIRIDHNKKIWISVTALLGIEAARVLITPDSVRIMNRIHGEYIAEPFSYIYRYTNREVTFKTLQDILIGNISPELLRAENVQVATSDEDVFVIGSRNGLSFQYAMNELRRPSAVKLDDPRAHQQLDVTYNHYNNMSGYVFPQRVILNVKEEDEVLLNADIVYNRVQFDQVLQYPFEVPTRYRVVK